MRIVILLMMAIYSFSALSDEPSVKYQCKEGFKQYTLSEGKRIHTCPDNKGNLKIDALSRGGNYHLCWLNGVAIKNGSKYQVTDDFTKCTVTLNQLGKEMNVKFTGNCKANCGARAKFYDGTYK